MRLTDGPTNHMSMTCFEHCCQFYEQLLPVPYFAVQSPMNDTSFLWWKAKPIRNKETRGYGRELNPSLDEVSPNISEDCPVCCFYSHVIQNTGSDHSFQNSVPISKEMTTIRTGSMTKDVQYYQWRGSSLVLLADTRDRCNLTVHTALG